MPTPAIDTAIVRTFHAEAGTATMASTIPGDDNGISFSAWHSSA